MARMTFGNKGGRVRATVTRNDRSKSTKTAEDVVREIKAGMEKPAGEDYRERSLAMHGLVCARCSREFDHSNRHLLTVHHKDGNHHNNPADGSNWENLCVYCHDNEHGRYLDDMPDEDGTMAEDPVDSITHNPFSALGDMLKKKT